MPITDPLATQLDRLAALEPGPFPFISLYLNLRPDQRGRDNFETFLRKELPDRIRTYAADGAERRSLEDDAGKIRAFLNRGVEPSANGLALFACSGADVFAALTLASPLPAHRLYVSDQPHLYPLARALDQSPRYAVLLASTRLARIFVVASHTVWPARELEGARTKRHKMGGWAQARYQRHIENYHHQHVKEVIDVLGRVVRDEDISSIIISGDEVIVPLLKEHLPKDLGDRVVDVMKLDVRAPEHEVLETTMALMRERDSDTDRARVESLLGAYRAGGLAVVGVEQTRRALDLGQVDELVIAAAPETIDPGAVSGGGRHQGEPSPEERAADRLIAKARQTSARIRFIEDASLLAAVGGVGALLRYKV
jgi:peptide chain release factor subunit 1